MGTAGRLVPRRLPRDALAVPDADRPDLDTLLLRLGQGTPESLDAERALAQAGDAALEPYTAVFSELERKRTLRAPQGFADAGRKLARGLIRLRLAGWTEGAEAEADRTAALCSQPVARNSPRA